MNNDVKISPLETLPESELYQKALEVWVKIIALSFGINITNKNYRDILIEKYSELLDDNPPT